MYDISILSMFSTFGILEHSLKDFRDLTFFESHRVGSCFLSVFAVLGGIFACFKEPGLLIASTRMFSGYCAGIGSCYAYNKIRELIY